MRPIVYPLGEELLDEEFPTGYQENELDLFYEYLISNNPAFRYYSRYKIDSTINEPHYLDEKYKEKFVGLETIFLGSDEGFIKYFAPIRNLDIKFIGNIHDDAYRNSLFQYIMSLRMERLLDKYDCRDTIGYFLASEVSNNRDNTNNYVIDERQLVDTIKTINVVMYYLIDDGSEEDKELLLNLLKDIYVDTDPNTPPNVVIYFYDMETEDKEIALKLLDEAKLSQNYIKEDLSLDNLGENMFRVRNNHDAFMYLDNFGIRREYLYRSYIPVNDDSDFEWLEKLKSNNRYN
ncbi:hypothetical protein JF818_03585 [Sphaerochaeta sp. S2]|nr:hypothetical protein [Sphaerochaeta sp. S2]